MCSWQLAYQTQLTKISLPKSISLKSSEISIFPFYYSNSSVGHNIIHNLPPTTPFLPASSHTVRRQHYRIESGELDWWQQVENWWKLFFFALWTDKKCENIFMTLMMMVLCKGNGKMRETSNFLRWGGNWNFKEINHFLSEIKFKLFLLV